MQPHPENSPLHRGAYAQTQSPTQTQDTATPSITILELAPPECGRRQAWAQPSATTFRSFIHCPQEAQHTKMQPPGDTGSQRPVNHQTQTQVRYPSMLQTPRGTGYMWKRKHAHPKSHLQEDLRHGHTRNSHLPIREL